MTFSSHQRVWNSLLLVELLGMGLLFFWFQSEGSESARQQLRRKNSVPEAGAGQDLVVNEEDASVILNGEASLDTDSDKITFFWSELSDPEDACSLRFATLALPTVSVDNTQTDYSCEFQLIVSDGVSDSVPDSVTVFVQADNDPPVFISSPRASAQEGERLYWDIWLSDPEEQAGSIMVTDENSDFNSQGISVADLFSDLTGGHAEFVWTPTYQQSGTFLLTLTGTDGEHTTNQLLSISVNNVNRIPKYTGGQIQLMAEVGTSQTIGVNLHSLFQDPDGDVLTFTTQETDSFSITIQAGEVRVNSVDEDIGLYAVKFIASDPDGQIALSPQIDLIITPAQSTEITALKGTKRGKGRIQLINTAGDVIKTFVAFAMGGVIPRLIDTSSETLILAVKNSQGRGIALFDLDGKVLNRGVLSTAAHWKPLFVIDSDGDSSTVEVVLLGEIEELIILSRVQIGTDQSVQELDSTTIKDIYPDGLSFSVQAGIIRGVDKTGKELLLWDLNETKK